jgi:hypothetical protein
MSASKKCDRTARFCSAHKLNLLSREAHIILEMETPTLVFPWFCGGAFQSNEELALEVQQVVETGEEEINFI